MSSGNYRNIVIQLPVLDIAQPSRRGRALPVAAALLCLIAGPAHAREPLAHRYSIAVDDDLATLRVVAHFAGPVHDLRAADRDASRYVADARDCDTGAPLRVSRRRMSDPEDGIQCLSYRVDLEAASAGQRRQRALAPRNVSVSPSRWLWRPSGDGPAAIEVGFDLPEGMRVAVPWTPVPGEAATFVIPPSPGSGDAPALFGDFDYRELDIAGGSLRVALASATRPYDPDPIIDWIRATAADASLAYGRFPNPGALVVVVPVASGGRWGRSPVPFGRVVRDGGEAVELFVDPGGSRAAFLSDWTATHEFSHLMVPYLASEARWISEGFAQYYQNVLLARSGVYDERTAWEKIHAGLQRGTASSPELSPNDAAGERRRGARMKMYWSGAALALLADVELRSRTGGRQSLDTVLDRLQRCCLPSERVWSGAEFMARLDELAGTPVFVPLYQRHADRPGFPDTAGVLASLGVDTDPEFRLDDLAERSQLRRDIMRRHPEQSAWRRALLPAP